VEKDMLRRVSQLKYADYDITNTTKFPELASHQYLELKTNPTTNQSIPMPKAWARGLEQSGILNLFNIPHFDQSNEVNACIKLLLTCVHGGYLWLDKAIYIDTDLTARITGLPMQGQDPNSMFANKKTDRTLLEAMRENFHTVIGVRRLDVLSICDPTVRIAMQTMACKLLRKCRKDQVPMGVIVAVEKCVKGVSMS
jgi:hypothetical protein